MSMSYKLGEFGLQRFGLSTVNEKLPEVHLYVVVFPDPSLGVSVISTGKLLLVDVVISPLTAAILST